MGSRVVAGLPLDPMVGLRVLEDFLSGLRPTTHWHQGFSGRGWSLGGV